MKNRTLVLVLLTILLLCLLPAMTLTLKTEQHVDSVPVAEGAPLPPSTASASVEDATALAERIQPDSTAFPEIIVPAEQSLPEPGEETDPVLVSAGNTIYAYEGMAVRNDGGTVYSTGATVTNMGGTVFCNGGTVYNYGGRVYARAGTIYNHAGTVYNYGGKVYARAGTVFNHAGTVYNDGADIIVLPEDDSQESRIYGYYELKLADYYEPYVTLEGVVNEPGAESMIISEDSVCRVTPKQGWQIVNAETTSGELVRNNADGSVLLTNVTGDTLLTLEIEPAGS